MTGTLFVVFSIRDHVFEADASRLSGGNAFIKCTALAALTSHLVPGDSMSGVTRETVLARFHNAFDET